MVVLESDIRAGIQFITRLFSSSDPSTRPEPRIPRLITPPPAPCRLRLINNDSSSVERENKPSVCTADELHYVSVRGSDWRLALWRYKPPPQAPVRNHPLLLLSGIGTNAIGFDLSPECSFARYMSNEGFDTWILELRGAGLSSGDVKSLEDKKPVDAISEKANFTIDIDKNGSFSKQSNINSDDVYKLAVSPSVGQWSLPSQLVDLQQRFSTLIEDFQKQLDLIVKYNWDFDHYLEEDVPAAMEYVKIQCEPKDGKLFAIGHSMGGILLYALLSRNGFKGIDSDLAVAITLGSSLDYTTSKSWLKLLLPLADPAKALSVPAIPLGALLAAAYPLASRPPYILSWLNPLISKGEMMHPELFEKLVINSFCTIPAKLLLQLATAFKKGGLCDRSGTFFYKDHLSKINVPVLAIAGDEDLICPPEAVFETVKMIPQHLVNYKVFGESNGPHYGHYDLVGSREAVKQVYPCIIEFLSHHDNIQFSIEDHLEKYMQLQDPFV